MFDFEKLARSVYTALRKRPVDSQRIQKTVQNIVIQLNAFGLEEVSTQQIGALVMEALKTLDPVGCVRFASVYQDFNDPQDFKKFIRDLHDKLD